MPQSSAARQLLNRITAPIKRVADWRRKKQAEWKQGKTKHYDSIFK